MADSIRDQTALFHFPNDADLTAMLYWLGEDYPVEIARWLLKGFDKQQPGTRLSAIRCMERPEIKTVILPSGTVRAIQAIFPLKVLLKDPQNRHWWLTLKMMLEGQNLNQHNDTEVGSGVEVIESERFLPQGRDFFEQLQTGIYCEKRDAVLEWGTHLDEIMLLTDVEVETEGDTHFLTWPEEAIFGGLKGDLSASFPPDRQQLTYVTLSPVDYAISGPVEEGLFAIWEFLTRLFGPPTQILQSSGYRWSLGAFDLLLLYRDCNEFHVVEDFHQWLAIHSVKEGQSG